MMQEHESTGSELLLSETFEDSQITAYDSFESQPSSVDESLEIIRSGDFTKRKVGRRTLGRLEGIFFGVNVSSLNNKYYPEKVWVSLLRDPQYIQMLADGKMLGTLEHPNAPSRETKEGLPTLMHPIYSAFVTKKLWINGGRGFGAGYVLNTPVGQITDILLNSVDEEGIPLIKMGVSARAWSVFAGKTKEGHDIIGKYFLHGFDVVGKAGVKTAYPESQAFEEYNPKSKVMEEVESTIITALDQYCLNSDDCACKLKSSLEGIITSDFGKNLLRRKFT